MASFQIINEGTPIYPLTIQVTAPIDVVQTLVNSITVSEPQNSPEFEAICVKCTATAENAYKTLPEFVLQDTTRDGVYTVENKGGLVYDITMSWTIQNAEIQLSTSTQTDLQGQSRNDLLQLLADSKVLEFKQQWAWQDL